MTIALRNSDRVAAAIARLDGHGADAVAKFSHIERSWLRSAQAHRLSPDAPQAPHILTAAELHPLLQDSAGLIEHARPELDGLYAIVGRLNYTVLLSNRDGVIVDHRGESDLKSRFLSWGSWLGGVWAEAVEGANGIGTTIAEGMAVTVHKTEHFRARHGALTCSGAPVFADTGEILGVVCLSSLAQSDAPQELAGALAATAARAIEERMFRDKFRRHWIIAARADAGYSVLLAVDRDRRIVGADPTAQACLAALDLDPHPQFSDIFERGRELLWQWGGADKAIRLTPHHTGKSCQAIATPPLDPTRIGSDMKDFLLRPRLQGLMIGGEAAAPPAARGGLAPAIIGRLRAYVDRRLDQTIDLKALAAEARLSAFHFARAFKQSQGVTPHHFILQRRLEKARHLLEQGQLSLAEIATTVGFADQSHFSRRFREHVGISPGEFRRRRQPVEDAQASPAAVTEVRLDKAGL